MSVQLQTSVKLNSEFRTVSHGGPELSPVGRDYPPKWGAYLARLRENGASYHHVTFRVDFQWLKDHGY